MKLLIDTNVQYHWAGLSASSIPPSGIDLISRKHKLYIASPSVIEACVHFRHDLDKVRRALKKIWAGELLFIRDERLPLDNTELEVLMLNSHSDASKLLDVLLERKIQAEARLLGAMLLHAAVCIYVVLLDQAKLATTPEQRQRLIEYIIAAISGPFMEVMRKNFAEKLREGYDKGKPQQMGKAAFEENLDLMIRTWAVNDVAVSKGSDPKTEFESGSTEIETHKLWKKLSRLANDKPVSSILHSGLNSKLDQAINEISTYFTSNPLIDAESTFFIDILIRKLLVLHGKLEKNDLTDMMILLGHIHVDHLVTEDENFRDRVNEIKPGLAISLADALLLN